MLIGRDAPDDVELAVEIIINHMYGVNQYSGVESNNCSREINYMSRFEEPRFGPIQIPIPTVVQTKGCGNGGRPPKSSSRF